MAFDPVSLALNGASILGGIFGKKRKHIDPEYLRTHFGPQSVARDTTELANYIMNSPYGQQLLANAAESGQNFQTDMAARAAASGLDPSSGGQAGAGDFATSAAGQAQNTFERQTKQGFYQAAMPIAAQQNSERQNAYINDIMGGGGPSEGASIWQGIGNAAGFAQSQRGPGQTAGMVPAGQNAMDVAQAAVGPAQQNFQIRPAGTAQEVAQIPAAAGTSASAPSPLARRLSARRASMSRTMTGQGLVQRAAPQY